MADSEAHRPAKPGRLAEGSLAEAAFRARAIRYPGARLAMRSPHVMDRADRSEPQVAAVCARGNPLRVVDRSPGADSGSAPPAERALATAGDLCRPGPSPSRALRCHGAGSRRAVGGTRRKR